MKLLLGIATYKRPEKLLRLLESLNNQTYKNFTIYIISDNNDFESPFIVQNSSIYNPEITMWNVQSEHGFVIGAWNRVVQENIESCSKFKSHFHSGWEAFIGLCDDVELEPNALEEIVKCHKENFPDTDGVCGFKQICKGHKNYTFKWFGQTLMGRKFIERYKEAGYKICCPDYYHFCQDEEMFNYANSLNKFFCCEDAVLNHYHPGFVKEEVDETHHVIRSGKASPKDFDFLQQFKREQADLLWGRDFKLLGGKNG